MDKNFPSDGSLLSFIVQKDLQKGMKAVKETIFKISSDKIPTYNNNLIYIAFFKILMY